MSDLPPERRIVNARTFSATWRPMDYAYAGSAHLRLSTRVAMWLRKLWSN